MSRLLTKPARLIALTLPFGTLGACVTPQTPRTVDSLCLISAPLPYTLVPRAEREAAAAEGRPVEDDGNLADSDKTREAIGVNNERWRSVCQPAGGR